MIAPQIPQMWGELFETALPIHQDDRIHAIKQWRKKWCKELHASHTFHRDVLKIYSGSDRLVEDAHRHMYLKVGELIQKNKWGTLQTDFNTDDEGYPHPFLREDRLMILVLGNA